jgi:hypothetical protein
VRLFELGVWNYMTAGRQAYLDKLKARYGPLAPPVCVPMIVGAPLGGDPRKLSRDEAVVLSGWRCAQGERTAREVEARLATDGQWLYVQLEETGLQRAPRSATDPAAGDHWRLSFAGERGGLRRDLLVGPKGRLRCQDVPADHDLPPVACDMQAVVHSDTSGRKRWTVSLALPLGRLLPGGPGAAGRLVANLARRAPGSSDEPAWVPVFGEADESSRLRDLVLETPEDIPTDLPGSAQLRELDQFELVGRWRLDEGQGAVVRDASPSHADGTVMNGAAWEKGQRRPFLRLEDRLSQYVDLGNDPAVNLTGPLTLEAWVRYQSSEVWYPAIMGKGYEASGAYSLHVRPGLTLWFEIDEPNGTRHYYNPTERSLTPGAWCHVVATYDGQFMRVFVNGREAGEGKPVTAAVRTTAEPLRIGWLGSYGYFNGGVRDVSLYRRALDPREVFARYLAGR